MLPSLSEIDELKQALEEGRRDGSLLLQKLDLVLEAALEPCARFILNLETAHPVRIQYISELRQIRKDLLAARQALVAPGGGAGFAVQIILPDGAGAPGTITAVGTIPGQQQVETPQAPIIDIPFDDLGLPATPDYVRAAAARIQETIA